jgi:hypothetical protein
MGVLSDSDLSRLLAVNEIHWRAGNPTSCDTEVREILAQVHFKLGLQACGVGPMNKVCAMIFEKLARSLGESAAAGCGDTAGAVGRACREVLTGSLGEWAFAAAGKVLAAGGAK